MPGRTSGPDRATGRSGFRRVAQRGLVAAVVALLALAGARAAPAGDGPAEPAVATPSSAAPARTPRAAAGERLFRLGGSPALVRPKPSSPSAPAPDPEVRAPGTKATIWLNRPLGEGDPPVWRLRPGAARTLVSAANRSGIQWPVLLGVLRVEGLRSAAPLSGARVAALLSHARGNGLTDRARVLARFNRAVGLDPLVTGLEPAKLRLIRRVLDSRRIDMPWEARDDVAAGRIDPRVLAVLLYLAETHGGVRVSSLHTGHPFVGRPGSVSAHAYGLAMDVAGLGGRSLFGRPVLVERAARGILLLPPEAFPQQVVSIASVRGSAATRGLRPDHIHVGF